jgi:SAM-dependent methyltransferase
LATAKLPGESLTSLNRDKTRRVFEEIGSASKEELLRRYRTHAWSYINRSEMEAVDELFLRLGIGRTLDPILDVGCGTGRFLIPLSRRYEVTGVDFSQPFLDQIKAEHPRIPLSFGEATKLPFGEASFGTVLCVRLIQHLTADEQRLFFEECRRVLKPGGLLVVMNYNALSFLTLYKKICQAFGGLWPFWPLRKWNWEVDDYHFTAELGGLFKHHGFEVLERIACTPGEPDMDRFLKIDDFLGRYAGGLLAGYYDGLMRLNRWGRYFPFSQIFSRVLVAGRKK